MTNPPPQSQLPFPTAPPLSPTTIQQEQQTTTTTQSNGEQHHGIWENIEDTMYDLGRLIPTQQELDDEVLARQLQAQENEFARMQQPEPQIRPPPQVNPTRNPPPYAGHIDYMAQDEEVAKKTLQEMRDEKLAFELQEMEQQRMRPRRDQVDNTDFPGVRRGVSSSNTQSGCTRKKCCNCIILVSILLGGSALVFFFGDSIWDKIGGNSDILPPFFQDKWGTDDSPEAFSEWKNKGKGLELDIRNALTKDWFDYFDEAFDDWNQSPSLSLSKEVAEKPDPNCTPIRGIMTVCNKNYGNTQWTGLNEVYYENGVIVSSVAKMNEFYLSGAGNAEKQYVMCHEIGHGFGLPHRDTSVNNRDLGTCLDYTNTYKNNMHPDEVDFENLESLYGVFRRRISIKAPLNEKTSTDQTPENRSLLERVSSYKQGSLIHRSDYGEIWERKTDEWAVVTMLLLPQ